MNYLSKIEDYFAGDLQGDALTEFENGLLDNPVLRKRSDIYRIAYNLSLIQEHILVADISRMTDFEFAADIYLTVLKYRRDLEMNTPGTHFSSVFELLKTANY